MNFSQSITTNRFNLLRYFIITALIAMLLFTTFYTYYLSNKIRRAMFAEKISFSKIIAEKLKYDFKHKIMIPALKGNMNINLKEGKFIEKLNHLMQEYQKDFNIRQINLIQKNRLIIYSTRKGLKGKLGKDSPAFQKAISGKLGTKLEYSPEDNAKTSLEIFVPFKLKGKIVGVVMIYQNINDVLASIKDNQADIIRTSIITMSLLFLILFLIVRQGDKNIKKQHKKLTDFNHKLEKKVKNRTKKLEELNNELKELAIRDGLTGLYNHTEIKKHLAKTFQQAKNEDANFSCLMIDIDHFKQLNDNFSHQFGDKVLKRVANAITEITRRKDTVGRYGGEEFTVLLKEVNYKQTYTIAERIRKNIKRQLFTVNKQRVTVTVSIGISTYNENLNSPDEVLKVADQALYQAKNKGRNQVMSKKGR
ncbi:hypothetical protein JCM16358_03520 [Halanaerocella petrolearia]